MVCFFILLMEHVALQKHLVLTVLFKMVSTRTGLAWSLNSGVFPLQTLEERDKGGRTDSSRACGNVFQAGWLSFK